jgi:hypothetical protein
MRLRKFRLVVCIVLIGGLLLVAVRRRSTKNVLTTNIVTPATNHRQPAVLVIVTAEASDNQPVATKKHFAFVLKNHHVTPLITVDRGLGFKPLSVLITVKTGHVYHKDRLPVLLQTWFNYAPNEVSLLINTLIIMQQISKIHDVFIL